MTGTNLPSNLCFRKSNKAFCIMSVTWTGKRLIDFKDALFVRKTPYSFIYWELKVTVQMSEVSSHKALNFTLMYDKA